MFSPLLNIKPTALTLLSIIVLVVACNKQKADNELIQESSKDSLYNIVIWAKDSTALPIGERKDLLHDAYTKLKNEKSTVIKLKNLRAISAAYKSIDDTSKFKILQKEYIGLADRTKDYLGKGDAHLDLGRFYYKTQADSSYYHFREAYNAYLQIASADQNTKNKPAVAMYYMAAIKQNNKDYVGAENEITKAIAYAEENKINELLFPFYTLLGVIQNGLLNFDEAIAYHNQAKQYIEDTPTTKHLENSFINQNNIASTYLREENFEKALEAYTPLLNSKELKNIRPQLYAKVLTSYNYSAFKTKNITSYEASDNIFNSNRILDSIKYDYDLARNYHFLSEINKETSTPKAIEYAYLAKAKAIETENRDRLLNTLELLTLVDSKNSSKHAKDYFELNETLQQEERNVIDKFARIQLETDQIIDRNKDLTAKNDLYTKIGIGIVIFALGLTIIISQRINNQRLRFKQKQQETNQEIYNLMLSQQGKLEEGKREEQKRVSQELHDGILGEMLGIRLLLSGLNEKTDEASINQRNQLITKLQELEEEIRTISHELNDASNKKVGNFVSTISSYLNQMQQSTNIPIYFNYDINSDWDELDGEIKINSYRIIQECIQNSIKHANCTKIDLDFYLYKNSFDFHVKDNGIGFDTKKEKSGIGLKNIKSRMEKLNGTFSMNNASPNGTIFVFNVPLI